MITSIRHLLLFGLLCLSSCGSPGLKEEKVQPEKMLTMAGIKEQIRLSTSPDSVLSNDAGFLADSVYNPTAQQVRYYLRKYDKDSCMPERVSKTNRPDFFKEYKKIGDINNDGKPDSVFLLPPLNFCEYDSGQSYYFTDTSLPRMVSESYCCHLRNFFLAPDIDEDGIREAGYFYSSCASRYKAIRLFSLQRGRWKSIGHTTFDIHTLDPERIRFSSMVKKLSKNRFAMQECIDDKIYWVTLHLQ